MGIISYGTTSVTQVYYTTCYRAHSLNRVNAYFWQYETREGNALDILRVFYVWLV